MFKGSGLPIAVLTSGLFLGCLPASAADVQHTTKMRISFFGVNVGTMKTNVKVSGKKYSISGSVASNPFVSLVARSRADYTSSGAISGRRVIPSQHQINYQQRRKRGSVRLAFARGDVKKMQSRPAVKYKKDAVPLKPDHLRAVLDPVSSLVFPVKESEIGDGSKICNRAVPVFDGKNRMNLKFRYKSSGKARVNGFSGITHTCSVRYQPLAGYRPHKKNIKFMRANRDMEVTMARIGNSSVYGLFAFKVRTLRGTARGKAYSFATQ